MNPIASIKQQRLPVSIDADYLRKQARQHIENLASDVWTDYNSHDPGITVLEVLAYAITDLGLRTQQPIENLLQNVDEQAFYSAAQVLPNSALSPNDYQRLLLSLNRVRDAQIRETRGDIEGLYSLNILLEGQLNESWIEQQIEVRGDSGELLFRTIAWFVPPAWQGLPPVWVEGGRITSISLPAGDLSRVEDPDYPPRYFAASQVTIDSSERLTLDTWVYTRDPVPGDPAIETRFRSQLLGYLRNRSLVDEHTGGIYPRFKKRSVQVSQELHNIYVFLNQHRNLCEDWDRVEAARIQQIAVCVEQLELHSNADPVGVLANIYFQLQQFIDVQIRPHGLDELLDDNVAIAEIFQGVQLEAGKGFILEEDLRRLERGNNLYTSDLLSLIMQVPGVFVLRGLSLRAFVDRLEVNRDVRNCLRLLDAAEFHPRLSIDDCEIQLFRQGVLVEVDMGAVKQHLAYLQTDFADGFPTSSASDLPYPAIQALDIETYHSIQRDFPQTWRLREGEITPDMPDKRKAQAKQLKSYLLFFEQLLANYCSQLAHIHELFSISQQAEHTYFYQPLYNVPAVQNLFKAYWDEQSDSPLSWDEFTGNCNAYIKTLSYSAEQQNTFRERRQLFIEHLMNRFSESFADYTAWVMVNNDGQCSSDLITDQLQFLRDLPQLSAKRATAFNYSARKQNDAGHWVADAWETENISGLQKRVAGLLGMPDSTRRSLADVFNINDYREIYDEIDSVDDGLREGRFRFWNAPVSEVYDDGRITSVNDVDRSRYRILLSSTRQYPLDIGLEEESRRVAQFAQQGKYFVVEQTQPTRSRKSKYYINLLDDRFDSNDPIARRIDFPANRGEVEQDIAQVIHLMQGRGAEGMHVLEHVLLRPAEGSRVKLLPFEFDLGNAIRRAFVRDPYSFQVSIFLPGWAPRFRSAEFRVIVERTLRMEIPAHILPWIYWVDLPDENSITAPAAFREFENAYQNWLRALANGDSHRQRDTFVSAFNTLVREPYVTLTNQNAYRPFSLDR